ncbi:hypothetical protein [uncultured Alistipes sp.]|jgi:hypothetical protein|uniref:hypothetical protein n=1 Tax=uncultured Alistipes sp. TaxID=538949 RepID=UPI0025F74C78|nr:hypothetical protein [uncultured Alistipes sp.]
MKNISKYLGVALLLFGVACSKSQEGPLYNPNKDDAKQIHFIQSSIEKEFAKDAEQGVIDLVIARTGNRGAYTVYLTSEGDDANSFAIPQKVTIADGEYSVTVPVEVDLTGLSMGSSYKTSVTLSAREEAPGDNGAQITQYTDKVNLSATFELTWETCMREIKKEGEESEYVPQLATFNYSLYYTGRDSGLEVEQAVGTAAGIDIYRIKDWASGVMFKFIHNTDDNTCIVPAQSIGYFHSTYNEYVQVSDMAVYTGNEDAYRSYPCTYNEQTNTYSFYLIYFVSGGYFVQGTETVVFESEPDTTPVVNISFEGIETTPTGFRAPKLYFGPNSYTKSYKASVVAGNITSDTERQKQVRQQLIDGNLEGDIPVLTLYAEDESVWNVPKGNFTAVALPYDADENPGALYTERFTFDPNDEYGVKVHEFEWYASDKYANYSPYTNLFWDMKVSNVSAMRYLCVTEDVAEYLIDFYGMNLEEITATYGTQVTAEVIAEMLSDEGRQGLFSNLDQRSPYTLNIVMTNQFGDRMFVSKTAKTYGYYSSDFDQTKTIEDFLGSFVATATVSVGSSKSETSYRMDISRLNDTEVIINGASDMRDFAPQLHAFYDKDKHMLIVDPQATGMYGENYTVFGLYDGLTLYWGNGSMAIGYIGDTLHWAASPYTENNLYGYMFLLFNSPDANGSTYLREYVGSKTYTFISMKPLKLASTQGIGVLTDLGARTYAIQAGADRTVSAQLMSDTVLNNPRKATVKQPAAAKTAPVKGKTLRTDLTLHTR